MNRYVFAMSLLALFLIGCSDQASNQNESTNKSEAPAKKAIVIGLDDNYPPIGFRNEQGELVGSDIELAQEAAKRLQREVIFKPIDWSSKEVELSSGKVDAIWNGLTPTPEREKNILFTEAYQQAGQVAAVKGDSPVQTLEDLQDKVIGIQEGSMAEDVLRKNPQMAESFKEVRRYADMVTVYMDLKVGRIDGAILDEVLARYYDMKEPGAFRVLPQVLATEVDAVGVAKNNTQLQQELNRVLKEMQDDGTMKRIFEKWFGKDLSVAITIEPES